MEMKLTVMKYDSTVISPHFIDTDGNEAISSCDEKGRKLRGMANTRQEFSKDDRTLYLKVTPNLFIILPLQLQEPS